MWKELTRLSDDENSVIAQLPPQEEVGPTFSSDGLLRVLEELDVQSFYLDQDAVTLFVNSAREKKKKAYDGIVVAYKRNAEAEVLFEDHDLLATISVTGAYGGRGLNGPDILALLAEHKVAKGINKNALKKVMQMSAELGPGETFTQPVAAGLRAKNGKDVQFIPLVEDVNERVLRPQETNEKTEQVDMRDLGETIAVEKGELVLKRIPATRGTPGYTVTGAPILPTPGKDKVLKQGKGTVYDSEDPNLLRADISGMPIIRENTVDVDPALCLKNIDVSTGHVKFKGSIIITGNIEPGMIVRATGSITVGGFIESADVQAQEDITVGQGIIGPAVDEGEEKSCTVKTNGSINTKYAQFAFLQAMGDINMELHSLNNTIMCSGNLTVMDPSEKKGTLSGGAAKVGGGVKCVYLGVEGDTATFIQPFVRFNKYKTGLAELRNRYKDVQTKTMNVVRQEMEYKKKPKEERTPEGLAEIESLKQQNNEAIAKAKEKIDWAESELKRLLKENTVAAREKVYTRVTIQFGDETVLTKREHNAAVFSFDQYTIHCRRMVEGKEVDEEEEEL
ncbi:FapA family protein [Vibrio sp. JC009]|uniref:DUF342 domain-containing protein n=1 Tax=Vibrio sp. JC009 TaxID=2912314 RepID=UPI0023B000AE|nr:FapA family protein [Vibrio sp. JC009]WED23563.1 FapA family protein [Vibrio sp. JC009]